MTKNEKIRESLLARNCKLELEIRNCLFCDKGFIHKGSKQFCSGSCRGKYFGKKNSSRIAEQFRKSSLERHRRGELGWKSRYKLVPSYPEKFVMQWLDWNHICYEREKKVGKYFIDFVINEKFALEIDGRQHDGRLEHDQKRDEFLTQQGFEVHRIRWTKPKEVVEKLAVVVQR